MDIFDIIKLDNGKTYCGSDRGKRAFMENTIYRFFIILKGGMQIEKRYIGIPINLYIIIRYKLGQFRSAHLDGLPGYA